MARISAMKVFSSTRNCASRLLSLRKAVNCFLPAYMGVTLGWSLGNRFLLL